jgi:glycosyltransferase involved in cell wall biosynthesis
MNFAVPVWSGDASSSSPPKPGSSVRVLLVTHEASRTGAPRVAVLVAQSLVRQGHSVRVVSRAHGPLLTDFQSAAPTSVEPLPRIRNKLWSWQLTRVVAYLLDTLIAIAMLARWSPDLIYVNTTAAGVYLRPALWLRRCVLLHVHESGAVATRLLAAVRAPQLDGVTLVACSSSVQADLTAVVRRPVALLPSVPDGSSVRRLAEEPAEPSYNDSDLVVGCCGTVEYRKGPDLWMTIASRVVHAVPCQRVRFVWLGEVVEPLPTENLTEAEAEFIGPAANPYPHLRRFDIATLPSRDDPFPLVVLEAMLLGTPVVAFDVGGVAEQIGDAGIVVPAGDIDAFAAAVLKLITDEDTRKRLGTAASRRADEFYSADSFATNLAAIIDPLGPPGDITSS